MSHPPNLVAIDSAEPQSWNPEPDRGSIYRARFPENASVFESALSPSALGSQLLRYVIFSYSILLYCGCC